MNDNTPYVLGGGLIAIIGIIMAVFAAIRTKPSTDVIIPVYKKESDIAQKKIDDAKVKEVEDTAKAKENHDNVVSEVIKVEEKRAEQVDDGKALNDFLKNIGGKIKS